MIVFHWAPVSRRRSIERAGLKPGSVSRNRQWRPPFISYSPDPAWALASANSYHEVAEPMDLWQVDLDEAPITHSETFSHSPDPHAPVVEVRLYERIPARFATRLATRRADE